MAAARAADVSMALEAGMWSAPDLGLFSNNVGPFSRNVVRSAPLFGLKVAKPEISAK